MSTEARQLFRLAVPVIVSQVGAMTMGIVDSMIVGRFSSSNSQVWLLEIPYSGP